MTKLFLEQSVSYTVTWYFTGETLKLFWDQSVPHSVSARCGVCSTPVCFCSALLCYKCNVLRRCCSDWRRQVCSFVARYLSPLRASPCGVWCRETQTDLPAKDKQVPCLSVSSVSLPINPGVSRKNTRLSIRARHCKIRTEYSLFVWSTQRAICLIVTAP